MQVFKDKTLTPYRMPWMSASDPAQDGIKMYVATYPNGRLAIQLTCPMEDEAPGVEEPFMTPTVNMVGAPCPANEVYIKNWNENEGATKWLIENGVIWAEPTGRAISGHIVAYRYGLTEEFMREAVRVMAAMRKQRGEASAGAVIGLALGTVALTCLISLVHMFSDIRSDVSRIRAQTDLVACSTDDECMAACKALLREDCEGMLDKVSEVRI